MKAYRLLAASVFACAVAATLTASGSATQGGATKQRIAILERVNGQGGGTFEIIPLTPGPLRADSGTVSHGGDPLGPIMREGQRLARASGTDELKGKQGSVRINRVIEIANVADGHRTYSGTWTLDIYTPTRQYKGFTGGGRLAAVEFPDGRAIYRHEGFVTKS